MDVSLRPVPENPVGAVSVIARTILTVEKIITAAIAIMTADFLPVIYNLLKISGLCAILSSLNYIV